MKLPVLLLLSILLFSNIAFAQQDMGELLFRSVLKMSQYPGAPFTGNIINDLIMFFFIPTVFIIVVIFTLVGRLTDNNKIAVLLGVAFYLFIVAGGYYPMFALLAGPYFLFLLIFMGLLLFFTGHFGLRRRGGGRETGMPHGGGAATAGVLEGGDIVDQLIQKKVRAEELKKGLIEARKANDPRTADYERQLRETDAEIRLIEGKISYDPVAKARYAMLKGKFHLK